MNELSEQEIKQMQNIRDDQKTHENIIKTIIFRGKMLETLRKYISQSRKIGSFNHCLRLFENEQNISVLNDGMSLFVKSLIDLIDSEIKDSVLKQQNLEIRLIFICQRLIESKYESHIENGLRLITQIYSKFQSKNDRNQKERQIYQKLIESKRITKILKQNKKVNLFQLAYSLTIKIKGNQYIEKLNH